MDKMIIWISRERLRKYLILFSAFLLLILILFSSCVKREDKDSAEDFYPIAELPLSPKITFEESTEDSIPPLNFENMKGVWVSYLEYNQLFRGKDQTAFEEQVDALLQDIKKRGLNTVILQVRSHGDAYYPSKYYPWSRYVTGVIGNDPGYDPLAIFLEKAHESNLSVQAWINPYRLSATEQMESLSKDLLIKQWYQKPEYMLEKDGYWYLNPGNTEVQKLILNGVEELVENYSIDGVQIDDYFYTISPDQFGQTGEEAKKHTTELVQGIYQTVKAESENILFGVSPAGNYEDIPKSDTIQYTDLVTWCSNEGYLDYVMPQIYWALDDETAPFETILQKWEALTQKGNTDLYIGIAAYKFAGTEMLSKQITCVENSAAAKGYCYFRYGNLQ